MDQKIEDIVRRLLGSLPTSLQDSAQGFRRDIEDNFRAVLQANLTKLDLLSREEFLAQTKVLERTRTRLEELERRLSVLEAKSSDGSRPESSKE
jgi:BMFP domain-containing protein YqiC